MKTIMALCLATIGMTSGLSIANMQGENKTESRMMAKAMPGGEIAKPHYRATGKPATAARGEQIFLDHCALCHGLHGKGDGPRSAYFQPGVQYIPDLTLAAFLKGRDAELMASIREGQRRLPEPAYVMPQFKYILSEEEIRSVFAYIKTFPGKAGK